jgi:hypothetical protein
MLGPSHYRYVMPNVQERRDQVETFQGWLVFFASQREPNLFKAPKLSQAVSKLVSGPSNLGQTPVVGSLDMSPRIISYNKKKHVFLVVDVNKKSEITQSSKISLLVNLVHCTVVNTILGSTQKCASTHV